MDALKGFIVVVFFIFLLGAVIFFILIGCTYTNPHPETDTQPRDLIIVKKGTMISNYKTQTNGVYLSDQTAAKLMQKIEALEAAKASGGQITEGASSEKSAQGSMPPLSKKGNPE